MASGKRVRKTDFVKADSEKQIRKHRRKHDWEADPEADSETEFEKGLWN